MTKTFTGFPAETLTFLTDLKANNARVWFNANKPVYERAIKAPAAEFCTAVTEGLEKLTGAPHGSKVFRIHRDVRFSKDKTPYNTHLHISFLPDGKGAPAWFWGLAPGSLSLGAGTFGFEKKELETFRDRIAQEDGKKLAALLNTLQKKGGRLHAPELKRVPAGYDSDHPHADLLRHKSLSVWLDIEDLDKGTGPEAVETCLSGFKQLKPVHDWLSRAGV